MKVLRTDNGGEYTSTRFEEFLRREGIRHERTVPKTPEQNGVAERMNRTLVETVRSMLIDAKLAQKFWGEALSTAVYLRNRSRTKAVRGMTPFEAWSKEKPAVGHLRVFGCDAYAHVPKDERKKLDSKAKKCIFVGYGEETKGYRLYDPARAKIIFSRDVVFKEEKGGETTDPEGEQYVELDLSHDEASPELESELESEPLEPAEQELPELEPPEQELPELEPAESTTPESASPESATVQPLQVAR